MHWLYKALLKVRPSQLAVLLKHALRIKRRVIHSGKGQAYFVDPVSHFGAELAETKIYEPVLTQLLETLLRPGDVFVDIGANEGYFSVLASSLVGAGKVYSVEPQSRLIPVIKENLRLNACQNVSVFQLALSDREGGATLHLTPSTNTGAASFYRHWKVGGYSERVETTSLDMFFRANGLSKVRLVKVDCEGAEALVISGAIQTLAQRGIEFLSVDFHPNIVGNDIPVSIDSSLRAQGYKLSQAGTGIWIYHLPGLEKALMPLGPSKEILSIAA